ncbi:hypothetical protein ACOSQ2_026729 [Xanthoceras sorbifolium]
MAEFGGQPFYSCRNCSTPLAFQDDLLSTSFMVASGKAYMFAHAMNIALGTREDKMMMTGSYTIANINCCKCGEELGWKYLTAHEPTQKYKEGNFVLENSKMIRDT